MRIATHSALLKSVPIALPLLLGVAMLATSCSRSPQFSAALNGKFDPAAAFRQHGYTVQNAGQPNGIRNDAYGYGWESWCGVIPNLPANGACQAIATAIRDELTRALSHPLLDELTMGPGDYKEGRPWTGALQYNDNNVHGEMLVWLTSGYNAVNYVIFLREERFK